MITPIAAEFCWTAPLRVGAVALTPTLNHSNRSTGSSKSGVNWRQAGHYKWFLLPGDVNNFCPEEKITPWVTVLVSKEN